MLNPIILFQTAQLKQDILKLKIKFSTLCKDVNSLKDKIKECISEVESEMPELIRKHHLLIEEINKKKNQNFNFDFKKQKNEEKVRLIDDETKNSCKELYKEIARKTHPDLINDLELNELFKEAVNKYEEFDYIGLMEISKRINTSNITKTIFEKLSVDVNVLNKEMEEINKQFEIKNQEMINIKSSVGYKIFQCFNTEGEYSKLLAEQLYSSFVINENVKLLQELSKD
jgi:hypothetical protein